MSVDISTVIQVTIERGTRTITQPGFGTMLILGPNGTFPVNTTRTYTSLDGVAEDFSTTDDEYRAAQAAFAQSPTVQQLKIGVRATPVAQVQTLDFDADFVSGNNIDMDINGVAITTVPWNASHAQTLIDLAAEIQSSSYVSIATVTGARQITITAQQAGVPVVITSIVVSGGASQANGTTNTTVDNVGVQEDLNTIQQNDKDWYALVLTSRDQDEVELAAAWIETQFKIFLTTSDDADVLDDLITTDIASVLQANNYIRTAYVYNEDPSDFADAAWLGRCLPEDPGSITWRFKSLAGIVASDLTDTQRANALSKNANIFSEIGGQAGMEEGIMADGEYIDIIRGSDWLQTEIETNIYFILVNSPKVPYTTKGIDTIENGLRKALNTGIARGVLTAAPEFYDAQPYYVNFPTIGEISENDRANRLLPDGRFEARLAGAIHKVIIDGKLVV